MQNQGAQRPQRLVLVPCPFQGHISPMLDLGTALHSKGFSITIAHTVFNSPNPSNHPNFVFVTVYDGLNDNDIHSGNSANLIRTLNTNFMASLEECLVRLTGQERVVCVIYDALMYAVDTVVDRLKLPSIILHTCGATAMAAFASLHRLHQEGYLPFKDSQLKDLAPGVHPLRFKDLPFSNYISLEPQLELIGIWSNIRRSSSIIWNSVQCLEQSALEELHKHHQVPFFSIGPLFKISSSPSSSLLEEDTRCINWLDKQSPKSVIYISLGSLVSMKKEELVEMAWGLLNSGQPFLWVIRPGSVDGSHWIELLPKGFENLVGEKGLIVKWAPQKDVLAHEAVGGFWSHCGWNSTLESISSGVPMICSPGFGDQNVNARYVSHAWKVGLEMDIAPDRMEIAEAVRRIMADEEGIEICKRVTEFKEYIELSTRKGGSSFNSLNNLVEHMLSLK